MNRQNVIVVIAPTVEVCGYNVRRYISVADYEAQNYKISKNLNARENDTRNTKTAIEYTCC